jgi:hypothetical protein
MNDRLEAIQSLDELRHFIHTALCDKENLVPEQFQMKEMTLVSRGRQCGLQFCLRGRAAALGGIRPPTRTSTSTTPGELLKLRLANAHLRRRPTA